MDKCRLRAGSSWPPGWIGPRGALYDQRSERDSSLIHHSDRGSGSQYVSIRYSERLAEAGVDPSVGGKGDSYDNALAETVDGLYKAEGIHRRARRSRDAVELATLTWVSWFNNNRPMAPLGYLPPTEAEANYYHQLAEQSAAAACALKPTEIRGGSIVVLPVLWAYPTLIEVDW